MQTTQSPTCGPRGSGEISVEENWTEEISGVPVFDEYDNIVEVRERTDESPVAFRHDGSVIEKDALMAIGLSKAAEFVELEKLRKKAEAEVEEYKEKARVLNETLLKVFALAQVKNLNIAGRVVNIRRDVFVSAKAEEGETDNEEAKKRLFSVLRKMGHGDSIKEGIDYRVLARIAKEFSPAKTFDKDELVSNLPPEFAAVVKVTVVPKITSRKA